jgi:P-type Cu+ transporter
MATDPVCGMTVDERTAPWQLVRDNRTYYFCAQSCREAFAEPERELVRLRRQLAVGWSAALVAVIGTYVVTGETASIAAWLAATIAQIVVGATFYRGLWDAIRARLGNMDVLIAVGTTAAYAYGTVSLFAPGSFPRATFFDASTLILALILTGNYLERLTRSRAAGAVARLAELRPAVVHRLDGDAERNDPIDSLVRGVAFRVLPGERIAADGVVRNGRTAIDLSLLTGESAPVLVGPGDRVLGGSLNGSGSIEVVASAVGEDSFLAEIGRLLTESEENRVSLQRSADRIAAVFVPFVFGLALVASVGWALLGGAALPIAVLIFVSVAITACPCAFGLATPAAVLVATHRAARRGILFRGGDTLERAAHVDLVLTDKTGTLTTGHPVLVGIDAVEPVSEPMALAWGAGLEAHSGHPLALAIRDAARSRSIAPTAFPSASIAPDGGLDARLNGQQFTIRPAADSASSFDEIRSELRRDGSLVATFRFRDEAQPGAAEAVARLHGDGIEVQMLSGDREAPARRIAQQIGIETVRARLTPKEKLAIVQEFQRAGRRVAFVGDGINDAPALAAADVGIAIGAGADVAREAGRVVLLRSDFADVPVALRIARNTTRKVRQNLAWAIGYNAVLLPIAAGALVPAFGLGVFHVLPVTGAIAMGLSSTLVLANSLTLRTE